MLLQIAFNEPGSAKILEQNGRHSLDKIRIRYLSTLVLMALMIKSDVLSDHNPAIDLVRRYHDAARKKCSALDITDGTTNREIISDSQIAETTIVFQSVVVPLYRKYGYIAGMESYIILWEYIGCRLRSSKRFTSFFEYVYVSLNYNVVGEDLVKLYVENITNEFITKYYKLYQERMVLKPDDPSYRIMTNYLSRFVVTPFVLWYTFKYVIPKEEYKDEEFLMDILKGYIHIPLSRENFRVIYPYLCPIYRFIVQRLMVENRFINTTISGYLEQLTMESYKYYLNRTTMVFRGAVTIISVIRYGFYYMLFFLIVMLFIQK